MKCFYTVATTTTAEAASKENHNKCHMNDTKLPYHLEEMLQIIIFEEQQQRHRSSASNEPDDGTDEKAKENPSSSSAPPPPEALAASTQQECLEFVLATRPLDLLSELATSDSPPGATVCILNWIRRFLSCLRNPCLEQESIFQPVQVSTRGLMKILKIH